MRPSRDHARAPTAIEPAGPRDVEAGAVDELLEHQRVLRLLDHLVVDVAELGRAGSGSVEANSSRPRLRTLSNSRPIFIVRRSTVQADPRARRLRLARGTTSVAPRGSSSAARSADRRIDRFSGASQSTSAYASKCLPTDCRFSTTISASWAIRGRGGESESVHVCPPARPLSPRMPRRNPPIAPEFAPPRRSGRRLRLTARQRARVAERAKRATHGA